MHPNYLLKLPVACDRALSPNLIKVKADETTSAVCDVLYLIEHSFVFLLESCLLWK